MAKTTSTRVPAYMRVYESLWQGIQQGTYPVHTLLPTEPQLEQLYGVSRTTVRRAIALLAQKGFVKVTQGRGTEVLRQPPFERFANITAVESEYLDKDSGYNQYHVAQMSIDETAASPEEAAALCLAPGESVYRLQRLFQLNDGRPMALLTNLLPKELVPEFHTHVNSFSSLYPFLTGEYGIQYESSEETITAKQADFMEAQVLQVPVGAPLLYSIRTAHCNRGPLEYAYTTYAPEVYNLKIKMNVYEYALL